MAEPLDGLNIPGLPTEYGNDLLANLDQLFARQEEAQANRLLDSQEERGLFRSGQTNQFLAEQVTAPAIDRRRQALLGLVGKGIDESREERLGSVKFDRDLEMARKKFENDLALQEKQAESQRMMLQLQAHLGVGMPSRKGGGAGDLMGALAQGFGGALGGGLGKEAAGGAFKAFQGLFD